MKILITEQQYSNLPDSHPYITDEKFELMKKFISSCKEQLNIKQKLAIKLKTKRDGELSTFAHYKPSDKSLCVYVKNRHIGDILRSIAHELKHVQQDLNGELTNLSGEDGSPHENEANSFAGVMMRKFGRINPQIFENYNPSKKKLLEYSEQKMSLAEIMHHYYEHGTIDDIQVPPLKNKQFEWLFNQMLSMIDGLSENNIDTGEILNVSNWGLKPNGDLAIFDIGFGNYFDSFDEDPEEFNINEENKGYDFMDKIFDKLGITSYKHLGGGLFGHAYDIGGNKVLKVTTDHTEAINSKKIVGKNLKHIANIYSVKSLNLDKTYYIITLEKLKQAQNKLSTLFRNLENYFYSYNSEHFNIKDIKKIKNQNILDFLADIFNYREGVWEKWREKLRNIEEDIDFNDIYELSTWIKGSPTNNNDVTDAPPYEMKELLKNLMQSNGQNINTSKKFRDF
jgi:hypothetical protein